MRTLCTFMLALSLAACTTRAQEVYVDNVVMVLDASGSMQGNMSSTSIRRIDAARSAIKEVMKTIPASTHIGLLVFGQTSGWVHELGPRQDANLFAAIDSIEPDGGTPLGAYMKIGADRLLQARKDQYGYGSYRLLIVTDGEAGDTELVESYTPDIVSRGIVVDAIGVDMPGAHTLATKVHSYRPANDPEALKRAIQDVFAEVGSAADGTSASDEAFKELEGLPTEAAMALIGALVSSGNQPIGGEPASDAEGVTVPPGGASPAAPTSGGGNNRIPFIMIIVAFFFFRALRKLKRR